MDAHLQNIDFNPVSSSATGRQSEEIATLHVTGDMRVTLAASIMVALQLEYPDSIVNLEQTTSGCPVVQVTTGGRTFNLTVTVSRKQPDHE